MQVWDWLRSELRTETWSGVMDTVKKNENGGQSEFRWFGFSAPPCLSFPTCEMGWYYIPQRTVVRV